MSSSVVEGRRSLWRGRSACSLANSQVQLTHLTGGGQIVDFHFHDAAEMNPFWIPNWASRDPMSFEPARDDAIYGSQPAGKLLSGIAGHTLCLGTFGPPSAEEIRAGATLHGEAGVREWSAEIARCGETSELRFTVSLPETGLEFIRTVSLCANESVIRIRETVRNQLHVEQLFQWQQHAALAPPFVAGDNCVISLPGRRGITDPAGYEGHELLASAAEFDWPLAPGPDGRMMNLRIPFQKEGTGFVAGVQVDPGREHGFVCAVNAARNLIFGYVFPRSRFPWVTCWEENRARASLPWQRREQVRALEFGASPLPLGRAETLRRGNILGTPTMACVPPRGEIGAGYLMFLARWSSGSPQIADIVCGENELRLLSETGETALAARGAMEFIGKTAEVPDVPG